MVIACLEEQKLLEHLKKRQWLQLRTLMYHPSFVWPHDTLAILAEQGCKDEMETVLTSRKPYTLDTSPFYIALSHHHFVCARILLEYGAPVNRSALSLAVKVCTNDFFSYVLRSTSSTDAKFRGAQLTAIREDRFDIFRQLCKHQQGLDRDTLKECYRHDRVEFIKWIIDKEQNSKSVHEFMSWRTHQLSQCIRYDAIHCLTHWLQQPYQLQLMDLIRQAAQTVSLLCLKALLRINPYRIWAPADSSLCSELLPLEIRHQEEHKENSHQESIEVATSLKYGKVWEMLLASNMPVKLDFIPQLDHIVQTYRISDRCEWLLPARETLRVRLIQQLEQLCQSLNSPR